MKFLRKLGKQKKTKMDKITNLVFRASLKIIPVEPTIELGQIRWLGYEIERHDDKLIRQIYEAKYIG